MIGPLIIKPLLRFVHFGQGTSANLAEARKVKQVNSGAIFAWISVLFFALVYLCFAFNPWQAFLINAIFLVLFPFILWFNLKGYLNAARVMIMIFSDLLIFLQYSLVQGTLYKIHYYFGALACIPVVLFPWSNYKWIWIFSIANVLVFAFCDQGFFQFNFFNLGLEHFASHMLVYLNTIGAVGTVVFAMIYSEFAAYNSERLIILERDRARTESLLDPLTRIGNRRKFDREIELEFARVKRLGTSCTLMLCDVDFFKKFNDFYGHPAGDQCLRDLSQFLKKSLMRRTDHLYRIGGEEFALLLPGMDAQGAQLFAEQLCLNLAQMNLAHSHGVGGRVSLSIGICTLNESTELLCSSWVESADRALYSAKASGRACWALE